MDDINLPKRKYTKDNEEAAKRRAARRQGHEAPKGKLFYSCETMEEIQECWFTNRQEILYIVRTHIWSSVSITVCCNTMTSDSAVTLEKSSTSFGQTCPFLTGTTMWPAGEWLQRNISLVREIHAVRVLSGGWRTRSTVLGAQCGMSTQQFISDEVCGRTFPACVCLHSINTCSAVYR